MDNCVVNEKLPRHVAIVMDGNGRWAEQQGLPRVEGHRFGVRVVKDIVQACIEKQIPVLSLFAFSSENWARPSSEVDFLMTLFVEALQTEAKELHAHGVRIYFTGSRERLHPELREQMDKVAGLTSGNERLTLNVVVNYGGKWDILQATRRIALDVQHGKIDIDQVDETLISKYLATTPLEDPDLLIRTSGEQRISNFFLWQLAFTELYFTEACWPAFNRVEFEKALKIFGDRERRYGKLSSQISEATYA